MAVRRIAVVVSAGVFARIVDEVLGHLFEGQGQGFAEALVGYLLGQGQAHAQHPFVAGLVADGVGRVAHAQPGMAAFVCEQRWPAQPAGQKFKQALLAACQVFGVHLADGPGLGQLVHQRVEALCQPPQRRLAAQLEVRGLRCGRGGAGCGGGVGRHGSFRVMARLLNHVLCHGGRWPAKPVFSRAWRWWKGQAGAVGCAAVAVWSAVGGTFLPCVAGGGLWRCRGNVDMIS